MCSARVLASHDTLVAGGGRGTLSEIGVLGAAGTLERAFMNCNSLSQHLLLALLLSSLLPAWNVVADGMAAIAYPREKSRTLMLAEEPSPPWTDSLPPNSVT